MSTGLLQTIPAGSTGGYTLDRRLSEGEALAEEGE
jgi:hypothetical protein